MAEGSSGKKPSVMKSGAMKSRGRTAPGKPAKPGKAAPKQIKNFGVDQRAGGTPPRGATRPGGQMNRAQRRAAARAGK